MNADISEGLFSAYLKKHGINYSRDFCVDGGRDVDFRIDTPVVILCDVKEVRDSKVNSNGVVDAFRHIRQDLNSLRKKFKSKKPADPVVLVSMNFSKKFFTASSVAHAMLGDLGVKFNENSRGELHHLPRGNASLTASTNTSISGIFVYDCANNNHMYFLNPFATRQIPSGFFPQTEQVELRRNAKESELTKLSQIMFWEYEEDQLEP